jgi:penicillin-binding protein 2
MTWLFGENNSRKDSSDLSTVFYKLAGDNRPAYDLVVRQDESINRRIAALLVVAFLLGGTVLFQIGDLQLARGEALAIESANNRLSETPVFGKRGPIYSASGKRLAWNKSTSSTDFDRRVYSTSTSLGNVVGYVSCPQKDSKGIFYQDDLSGEFGVEGQYNERLQSKPGRKIYETDATQQVISESTVNPPEDGERVDVTLRLSAQKKLYNLMKKTAKERGFTGGAAVLMDIETGKLRVAASYPGFSSQRFTNGADAYVRQLREATSSPHLNRVSQGEFTPGSVIKPFVATAALAEGVVTQNTTIVSRRRMRVENPWEPGTYSIFKDWKAHGPVQLKDALAVSSNVYFYQVGGGFQSQPGLGIERVSRYSRAFGFGDRTGIAGLAEKSGVVPDKAWKQANFQDGRWRVGDTYNAAIGQYGYQVTPLQVVRAVGAVANGGKLATPRIVKSAGQEFGSVSAQISAADYKIVRSGMRQAVTTQAGTASNLQTDYTNVAAKTGTAELGGDASGVNSWVVGFYPYQNPKYAFAVVMERGPRSNAVGGLYVMRQFLDWANETDSPLIGVE